MGNIFAILRRKCIALPPPNFCQGGLGDQLSILGGKDLRFCASQRKDFYSNFPYTILSVFNFDDKG